MYRKLWERWYSNGGMIPPPHRFHRNVILQDPFGDHRGQYEYSSILTRLKKLKNKLEDGNTMNTSPQIDSYTQKIIDAADLNSNLSSNNNTNLDDIFDDDQDNDDEDDEDNL